MTGNDENAGYGRCVAINGAMTCGNQLAERPCPRVSDWVFAWPSITEERFECPHCGAVLGHPDAPYTVCEHYPPLAGDAPREKEACASCTEEYCAIMTCPACKIEGWFVRARCGLYPPINPPG